MSGGATRSVSLSKPRGGPSCKYYNTGWSGLVTERPSRYTSKDHTGSVGVDGQLPALLHGLSSAFLPQKGASACDGQHDYQGQWKRVFPLPFFALMDQLVANLSAASLLHSIPDQHKAVKPPSLLTFFPPGASSPERTGFQIAALRGSGSNVLRSLGPGGCQLADRAHELTARINLEAFGPLHRASLVDARQSYRNLFGLICCQRLSLCSVTLHQPQ